MPQEERTCCRWTLTVLHVLMCLTAGACILSVLLLRGEKTNTCLPSLLDEGGKEVQYTDNILDTFCEVLLYASGAISGWSILSFFVHCCWESKICFALQAVIFVVITVLCLVGSASLTTQFLLWCNNLQTLFPDAATCDLAATRYDDIFSEHKMNMSLYYRTDVIQQSCTWSLALLSLLLSFIYISLMCVSTVDYNRTRVIYVKEGEHQPLLPLPGERE